MTATSSLARQRLAQTIDNVNKIRRWVWKVAWHRGLGDLNKLDDLRQKCMDMMLEQRMTRKRCRDANRLYRSFFLDFQYYLPFPGIPEEDI